MWSCGSIPPPSPYLPSPPYEGVLGIWRFSICSIFNLSTSRFVCFNHLHLFSNNTSRLVNYSLKLYLTFQKQYINAFHYEFFNTFYIVTLIVWVLQNNATNCSSNQDWKKNVCYLTEKMKYCQIRQRVIYNYLFRDTSTSKAVGSLLRIIINFCK